MPKGEEKMKKLNRWFWNEGIDWLILAVLCLSILGMATGCKKNLPTSPDLKGAPVISYFRAAPSQILLGESSVLSWKVRVSGLTLHHTLKVVLFCADKIHEFSPGIKVVERTGTLEVEPKATTVYTLVASVGKNKVSKSITVFVGL